MNYPVNNLGRAVRLDLAASTAPVVATGRSAIDDFLAIRMDVLSRSGSADRTQLGLLLLWVMSASESYFRRIFGELGATCPVAREKMSSQVASVGAIEYFELPAHAVMDAGSLSDPDSIKKRSLALAAVDVAKIAHVLEDYDQVCQIRHALIHSSGQLGYTNQNVLKLRKTSPVVLSLDIATFQTSVVIIENLVRTYNQHAFDSVVERWIQQGLLTGVWVGCDKALVDRLYKMCQCKTDGIQEPAYRMYQRLILASIRSRLSGSSRSIPVPLGRTHRP